MTAFLLIMILALPANRPAAPDPTLVKNAKLIALLKSLHDLTPQKLTDEQIQERIRQMVKPLTVEDTARLAMLAYDMINGPAEDESIDNVYWRAFWVSSEKLAERHDDWSVMLLDRIARRADIDGGERMTMNELIEKQRKAAEAAKRKR